MEKILVIDDDEPISLLIAKILKKEFDVKVFTNCFEAFSEMESGYIPDLIISDIKMPSFNGLEFLDNLKKSGIYRDIPFIILTGWDSPTQKRLCLDKGAADYIIKPFNPESLLLKVKNTVYQEKIKLKN